MSKMPAKKKSCFQITSVTQAQVAASSITDDTESLDDPDESRTEDVSSEIFDVSRADFEPEVCDRSSSEETLNNVGGESEAHGFMALHIPQEGQLPAVSGPPNGGFAFRSTAVSSVTHVSPHVLTANSTTGAPPATVMQQSAPVGAGGTANVTIGTSQQPPAALTGAASSTTTTASCSSRFRVIKLDHGTGEPFRRGRWTCTEFYDKDQEGSSVISRTVDNVKPAGALDQIPERDSGLGTTGGSVVAPSAVQALGPDSSAEASSLAPAHLHPVDPQQGYGIGHQPSTGAFQPLGYTSGKPVVVPVTVPAPVPVPAQPQVQVGIQQLPVSTAPQNLLPTGHNGVPVQKSSSMPPATQSQQLAYSTAHQLPSVSPVSQSDYRPPLQQPQLLSIATAAQTLPVASISMGPPVSQGPSPVMTPAIGGAQVLGLLPQSVEPVAVSMPGAQPLAPAIQGVLQQPVVVGGGAVSTLVGGIPQQLPSGLAGIVPVSVGAHAAAVAAPPGVQNVPTAVPGASSTPLTLPNLTASAAGQMLQGTRGGAVLGLGFGQVPAVSQVEENRRKSDALPQPSAVSGKDIAKPLIPESLQLQAPSVNSLFGIPIPLDGDEDRNPSTAFYLAFPPGRVQDSKSHSDSASGASVVAIDNKIEQAMDLVKSHLMYAVREEVEVLKEQIKELYERNSVLERENAVLKSLANSEQLSQLSSQLANPSSTSPQQPPTGSAPGTTLAPQEGGQPIPHQPNVSSA